jgi:hypothetical protein
VITFSGFKIKPTRLLGRRSDIDFFEFIPIGSGGQADNVRLTYECKYCHMKMYKDIGGPVDRFVPLKKLIIDQNKWDGSDIFVATGFERLILITERVKDVIIKNGLKGSIIVEAENFEERIY